MHPALVEVITVVALAEAILLAQAVLGLRAALRERPATRLPGFARLGATDGRLVLYVALLFLYIGNPILPAVLTPSFFVQAALAHIIVLAFLWTTAHHFLPRRDGAVPESR